MALLRTRWWAALLCVFFVAAVTSAAPSPEALHRRWADAAFELMLRLNSSGDLRHVQRQQSAVYLAERPSGTQLLSALPDGPLTSAGAVDAVLVVDPFPDASWGHLVTVFNVERHHAGGKCGPFGGVKLETGECVSVAVKTRCLNQLDTQYRPPGVASRCQVNFLPEVRVRPPALPPVGGPANLLSCRPLPGFGMCPRLRPLADTSQLLCEGTQRGCNTAHFVETRCRLFETCDQAVLVSGGWNRLHSDQRSRLNMLHMYRMFRHTGFHKHNIKVFFANGRDNSNGEDEAYPRTYLHPSAMKLGLRYHLRKMCAEPHCVDSLVLYLNSPAAADGSMLLWDADDDGIASRHERYQTTELLSDLASCAARQVLLLVDQSFSGRLVQAVAASQDHANLQVISAGGAEEYSWGGEFARAWSSTNHSRACVTDISQSLNLSVYRSHPEAVAMPEVPPALTLFGAPCDISPALTATELSRLYRGCQNLPLTVWLRGRAGRPPAVSLDQLVQETVTRRRRR